MNLSINPSSLNGASCSSFSISFRKVVFSAEREKDSLVSQLPDWVQVGNVHSVIALFPLLATESTAVRKRITQFTICHNHWLLDKVGVVTKRRAQRSRNISVRVQKDQLCTINNQELKGRMDELRSLERRRKKAGHTERKPEEVGLT